MLAIHVVEAGEFCRLSKRGTSIDTARSESRLYASLELSIIDGSTAICTVCRPISLLARTTAVVGLIAASTPHEFHTSARPSATIRTLSQSTLSSSLQWGVQILVGAFSTCENFPLDTLFDRITCYGQVARHNVFTKLIEWRCCAFLDEPFHNISVPCMSWFWDEMWTWKLGTHLWAE